MLKFKTLKLAPIDFAPVDAAIMTEAEFDWFSAYYRRMRETITLLVMTRWPRGWRARRGR